MQYRFPFFFFPPPAQGRRLLTDHPLPLFFSLSDLLCLEWSAEVFSPTRIGRTPHPSSLLRRLLPAQRTMSHNSFFPPLFLLLHFELGWKSEPLLLQFVFFFFFSPRSLSTSSLSLFNIKGQSTGSLFFFFLARAAHQDGEKVGTEAGSSPLFPCEGLLERPAAAAFIFPFFSPFSLAEDDTHKVAAHCIVRSPPLFSLLFFSSSSQDDVVGTTAQACLLPFLCPGGFPVLKKAGSEATKDVLLACFFFFFF